MAAFEKDKKGDKTRTFIFLTCIGQKEREIYETFTLEPSDEIVSSCSPNFWNTVTLEKNSSPHVFHIQVAWGSKPSWLCDWITELKNLSSKCEFDILQDYLIKDMIKYGARDSSLCERFLWECNLTLSKSISAGHAAEKTHKYAQKTLRF